MEDSIDNDGGSSSSSDNECDMEDSIDHSFPPLAAVRENKMIISQSPPILSTKKVDHADQRFAQQLQQSSSTKKKPQSYVLPTPDQTKNSDSQVKRTFFGRDVQNYLHSPLQQNKFEKVSEEEKRQSLLVSRNSAAYTALESKKFKRMAYSGPLNKSTQSPVYFKGNPKLFSGPLLHSPVLPSSSPPKLSPNSSSPRPPPPPPHHHHQQQLVHHSGPLLSKKQGSPMSNKLSGGSKMAPPLLLPPPQTVPCSFSVPYRVNKSSEESRNSKIDIDLSSPPLTPISFPIL